MYDHILLVAHEYLDEVEICASLTTDTADGKTPFGEELFRQACLSTRQNQTAGRDECPAGQYGQPGSLKTASA